MNMYFFYFEKSTFKCRKCTTLNGRIKQWLCHLYMLKGCKLTTDIFHIKGNIDTAIKLLRPAW